MSATLNPIVTVTSDGRKGADFVCTLTKSGWRVSSLAEDILHNPEFDESVTNGVTYRLVVIKSDDKFSIKNRTTLEILEEGRRRRYRVAPAEVALLLREKLSNAKLKKLGFTWLVLMHKPIRDFHGLGDPSWLTISCDRNDKHHLLTTLAYSSSKWCSNTVGFVCLAPEEAGEVNGN